MELAHWIGENFVAVLMFIVAMAGLFRNGREDAGESAALIAEMRADIKYIRQSMEKIEKNYENLSARVLEVERKLEYAIDRAKAAHSRLDRAGVDTFNDDRK